MTRLTCGFLFLSMLAFAPAMTHAAEGKGATYATPEEAAKNHDFVIQGEYTAEGKGLQVLALGEGKFRLIAFKGGLPGAGWDGKEKSAVEGDADKVLEVLSESKFESVERKSDTLGAKAPEGAIVLFDGTKETLEKHWKPGTKMTEDGLLEQGAHGITNAEDFQIHIEFRLPFMPDARGQGRGNSGYYVCGRYEIQMLDSFGLEGLDNECGGIYQASRPAVNMCLPPLAWQTYDVDFTAPKFDADGKKTSNAVVTVKHNGVVIHDQLELKKPTPGGVSGDEKNGAGPVFLQNHGNPVRYRNIWMLPKSATKP
ncbi:MAG: DUF1080 domain-containing protein [Planctomycetaceae bacterium]